MSVYRVTEVIGTSTESWEAAARSAVETAAATVRELRVAEVVRQDVTIENGSVTTFRVQVRLGELNGRRGADRIGPRPPATAGSLEPVRWRLGLSRVGVAAGWPPGRARGDGISIPAASGAGGMPGVVPGDLCAAVEAVAVALVR